MIFTTPIPADREASEVWSAEKRRKLLRIPGLLDRQGKLNTEEGLAILDAGQTLGVIDETVALEQRSLAVYMGSAERIRAYRKLRNRNSSKKFRKEARIEAAKKLGVHDVEILIEHDPDRYQAFVDKFNASFMRSFASEGGKSSG